VTFAVAYWVPHNAHYNAVEYGVITRPGFDSELTLVDLYEVDAVIKSFESPEEAQAWIDGKLSERKQDQEEDDEFFGEVEEVLGS
jgi:hypothetical protein